MVETVSETQKMLVGNPTTSRGRHVDITVSHDARHLIYATKNNLIFRALPNSGASNFVYAASTLKITSVRRFDDLANTYAFGDENGSVSVFTFNSDSGAVNISATQGLASGHVSAIEYAHFEKPE